MRTPNLTLYNNSRYQLNRLTNEVNKANEVMSTQKRINNLSDDPVGVSQVLTLTTTTSSLEQYNTNMEMGKTWLKGVNESLESIQDLLLKAQKLANQMSSDTMSATERSNEVETVEGYIDQIMALMNTQVNGAYVFGGTETSTAPFSYDDVNNPTRVDYSGNGDAFTISTSKTTTLEVGRDGKDVITENKIIVDSTNNKIFFTEDPGSGSSYELTLETTIPAGEYTKENLAIAVENAMNEVSADEGYGVTYDVTYNEEDEMFSIVTDGTYDGYMGFSMLWESGGGSRVANISTDGIALSSVDITVDNGDAMTLETPEDGTAPIRLTWDEDESTWNMINNPGYVMETEIMGTPNHVELDLDNDGATDVTVSLSSAAQNGDYIEFDILDSSSEQSIGPDMGFTSDAFYQPPKSNTPVTVKTFDNTNNVVDFREESPVGTWSTQLSAVIPEGDYSSMDQVATALEASMEDVSTSGIDYQVSWNADTNRFNIQSSDPALGDFELLWAGGTNNGISAATELGFDIAVDNTAGSSYTGIADVHLFEITADNNAINFKELLPGVSAADASELTAYVSTGSYDNYESFAGAVEDALEDASAKYGNRVDYKVSYDYNSHTFSIKEDGTLGRKLEDFQLLWDSGSDADSSVAGVLGFKDEDVSATPVEGGHASWTVFDSLYDFKNALSSNDVDGIERAMTRLGTHYKSITSQIADVGIKTNRLTTTQVVISTSTSSMKERKSTIENADFIEATMNLTAIQTAYQAALSSTSTILNVSLVDYM